MIKPIEKNYHAKKRVQTEEDFNDDGSENAYSQQDERKENMALQMKQEIFMLDEQKAVSSIIKKGEED